MIPRQTLVVLGGIVAFALARPSSAAADAPASPPIEAPEADAPPPLVPDTRWLGIVRSRLAADRLPEAELLLRTKESEGLDSSVRLAAMQLRFVVDAWNARGRVPPATRVLADPPDASEGADSWHLLLTRYRDKLVAGDYAQAAALLRGLEPIAPDPRWASAARELVAVAEEVGETHGMAPAVSSPTAPDSLEPSPLEAPPATARRWYGGQTLLADGLSVLTMPIVIGFGGYLLATPIIHVAHGRVGRAVGSLAMRVGFPFALAVVGAGGRSGGRGPSTEGVVVGGVLGMATAIVIDAAVLAYEPAPKQPPVVAGRSPGATLFPRLGPRPEGGFDAGLAGRF
jgi:hypothetical protein